MTLKDFENHIDATILQKGAEYFFNHSVQHLEDIDRGLWFADVFGTATYSVDVKTNRTQIKHWDCDCSEDDEEICEHVVAVFYAIAEQKDIVKEVKGLTNKSNKGLKEIFSKVSKAELEKFLTLQFTKHKTLKDKFTAHFVEYLEQSDIEKMRTVVRSNIKIARGNGFEIENQKMKKLSTFLKSLLKDAVKQLQQGNVVDCLATIKVIIEELYLPQNNFIDTREDIVFKAFEIFRLLIEKAPPMLKDELFDYCITENKNRKYYYSGNIYFIELMGNLITIDSQEEQWFKLIEEQIKKMENNGYDAYDVPNILFSKLDYLKINNSKEEVEAFFDKYNNYSSIRALQVDDYIEREEYSKAQQICLEMLNVTHDRDFISMLLEKLLVIAQKTKNTKEIRKCSEQLFKSTSYDFIYYNKLKSTYPAKEWKPIYEGLIKDLSIKDYWGEALLYAYEIANIYFLENENEKLLAFFQKNTNHFDFIHKQLEMLLETHPNKALEIYKEAILIHAENVGRSNYREVERALKKMNKLKGGSTIVEELVRRLKEKHKKRPALISILTKSFG